MKRNINNLKNNLYDVLVIGGGISGAALAWEAQSRGLKTALLEKDDFASHTSSATSKMIHGGLRYLKNGEFSLVRESLRERAILSYIAPHLIESVPFHLNTTRKMDKVLMWFGLKIYDLLSFDRNKFRSADQQIPASTYINSLRANELEPLLGKNTGGMYYYDGHVSSPERLVLEFVLSAFEKGADIANHMQVEDFLMDENTITGVKALDKISGQKITVQAKLVINASGPWADELLKKASFGKNNPIRQSRPLVRSKGIHIITKKLCDTDHVLTMTTKKDGHFFIIPWRDHSIIGTTDTKYEGNPDNFKVTPKDVSDLIKVVNKHLPKADLTHDKVLNFYGGMRPMATVKGGKSTYNLSRKHEIIDPSKSQNLLGILSVIGGKYTTSRALAKNTIDLAFKKLELENVSSKTHFTALAGGEMRDFNSFKERLRQTYPNLSFKIVTSLAQNYGSRAHQLLKFCEGDPKLLQTIDAPKETILAQMVFAVTEEMACSLEDILLRRTSLGAIYCPNEALIQQASNVLKEHLGLSDKDLELQAEVLKNRYYL